MIDVEIGRIQSPDDHNTLDWLDTVTGYFEALYHDLKTPMAILFNQIQAMEKIDDLPPTAIKHLADIKRSSFRMAKLVRDANDRSRLNQGLLEARYVTTDAVALVRNICDSAQALMQAKAIKINFESAESSFKMAMDRQMWERIILNLLANCKDFSYQGGEILVNIDIEGGDFVLSIRDYGLGISEEVISHVFSRHVGSTKRGLNSGLGLYIVKELVSLMNGEVQLIPTNPGTKVLIRVPIVQTEDEQEMLMTIDDFFSDNMVQMELSNL